MFKELTLTLALLLIAAAASAAPKAGGETDAARQNASWNSPYPEKTAALALVGNVDAGRERYRDACESCHLANGGGVADGSVPQLAGQHTTVLIKQLADIRAGLRDNPTMYPFAMQLADAQALADVAAYIETLCIPRGTGQYEAPDAAQQIALGKTLFEQGCTPCHQASGDGVKEKFYPVVAGQHYAYLLRQLVAVRDGQRGNAHPSMVRVTAAYDDRQLVAISAYQASLATRVRGWTVRPRLCSPD